MFDPQQIQRIGVEEALGRMPVAAFVAEAPSGKLVFVNDSARRMIEGNLGRPMPSDLGEIEDFLDLSVSLPDGRPLEPERRPLVRAILSGEEVRDEEYVYTLAEGGRLTIRCSSWPVLDEEGRVLAGVLLVRDVTEERRAEERRRYHAYLLENIHDAVIATDEKFLVTAWNKGAQQMYGWRTDEVLGRHLWEAVPVDMSEEQRAEALRNLAERGRVRTEAITYAKDGTPVYVEGITVALRGGERGDGEIIGYVNIRRAITERKRAEEELRESSRRTEDILESITDAFYAVDRDWRYTYINERALHLLQWAKEDEGLTREYLLGKNMWEVFPEAVSTVFYDIYHEAVREQKVVDLEEYYSPSDVWVEVHAYPFEGGLAFYWRDITERKQAEEEIERRAHQQAVVADLGLRALAEHDDLQALMDETVALVARTLDVEYSKIVELLPGGEELLLRAGVGWREGLVGEARERAGLGSLAGYTALISNEAVIVEDLREETRFEPPPLLVEHGVVSGMSVVIPSTEAPFGVLGAHTTSHRTFSEDDINFLQAVANVLATAIERQGAQEKVEEGREAERSRIARDIHDEPLQELTDALVQLQQIQRTSEDSQQTLTACSACSRHSIGSGRS